MKQENEAEKRNRRMKQENEAEIRNRKMKQKEIVRKYTVYY